MLRRATHWNFRISSLRSFMILMSYYSHSSVYAVGCVCVSVAVMSHKWKFRTILLKQLSKKYSWPILKKVITTCCWHFVKNGLLLLWLGWTMNWPHTHIHGFARGKFQMRVAMLGVKGVNVGCSWLVSPFSWAISAGWDTLSYVQVMRSGI